MLSVLLIWIYMLFTVAFPGAAALCLLLSDEQRRHLLPEDAPIFGIMIVTVYAQVFSLFSGVGAGANALLLALCGVSCLYLTCCKRTGRSPFLEHPAKGSLPNRLCVLRVVGIAALVLLMAFGTSRGYLHYDSDVYHAQAIRWIEEYGVVKGLGNFHGRLAYNSSSFALSALYSFAFLGGQSYHACAGFLATLVLLSSLRILHLFRDRALRISDFARLGGIYYVLNIYDEMVSPATDYFAMLLFLYILIRTLDLSEDASAAWDADLLAVPALLSVFLATLKLSAAGMVLLCLLPVIWLIREKHFGRIGVYVLCSAGIALPFFLRAYYLSGWALYPSMFPDLWDPAWKIPELFVRPDADYIIAFGRGYSNMEAAHLPLSEWLPHWFAGLGGKDRLLVLSCAAAICLYPVSLFLRRRQAALHMAEGAVILSFFAWLFSSPLVRYGQAVLLLLPLVLFGDPMCLLWQKLTAGRSGDAAEKPASGTGTRILRMLPAILVLCFLLYKTVTLGSYIYRVRLQPFYLTQQDYGTYETYAYQLRGLTVYGPVSGDRTGYDPFPTCPQDMPGLSLFGDSLEDGFYQELR
ncbi:MAG: hypothetical protein IKS07_05940 [Lachnospiraceae bacterium]|nr:hypothetical protein [Lachnospiraceae bacterium]